VNDAVQEVTKTLKAILESEWNLTGSVAKTEITFRRGEPFDLTTRFVNNKINIEIDKMTRPITKRTLARSMSREIATVTAWFLMQPMTDERKDEVKDQCQQIEDEIERIIKLKQRALTDIKFAKVGNVRYLPRYDEDPPTLRAIMNVLCQYEK